MQPSSPTGYLYGTPLENISTSANETRAYTYATAVNTDNMLDLIDTVNDNIIALNDSVQSLSEDFKMLAEVLLKITGSLPYQAEESSDASS